MLCEVTILIKLKGVSIMYTAIKQRLKEIYVQEIYKVLEIVLQKNRKLLNHNMRNVFRLQVKYKEDFRILRDFSENKNSLKFYEQKDIIEEIEKELGIEIKLELWEVVCFGSITITAKENSPIQQYAEQYNLSTDFEKQQLEHLAMATVFALRKAVIDGNLTIESPNTLHIDTVKCLSDHSYYMSCVEEGMSSLGYSSIKYDSIPFSNNPKKFWIIKY